MLIRVVKAVLFSVEIQLLTQVGLLLVLLTEMNAYFDSSKSSAVNLKTTTTDFITALPYCRVKFVSGHQTGSSGFSLRLPALCVQHHINHFALLALK